MQCNYDNWFMKIDDIINIENFTEKFVKHFDITQNLGHFWSEKFICFCGNNLPVVIG